MTTTITTSALKTEPGHVLRCVERRIKPEERLQVAMARR